MSQATVVLLGRDTLGTVVEEATFNDETQAHAAGDSFKFVSFSYTPTEERVPRRDIRSSRSEIETMIRNRSNEWNCSLFLLPRGTTTPPDAAPLFTAAIGDETVGASDVTYSYAATPPSVGLIFTGGNPTPISQTKIVGALVEEMTITVGSEEPKVEFSGVAARIMKAAGQATLSAGATSATQTLQTGEAYLFEPGTILSVDADVNLRVSSRDVSSDTITFSSSITGAQDDVVRPYTPWSNSTTNMGGRPIASWNNTLTFAGTTYQPNACKVMIKNNWLEHRVMGSQTMVDASPGHQEVTGSLTFRATAANLRLLMYGRYAPTSAPNTINPGALVLTLGDATNGRVTITLPQVELNFTGENVPENEDATFEIPFRAMTTTASGVEQDDAITIVWD